MHPHVRALFLILSSLLAAALAYALVHRSRARAATGPALQSQLAPRGGRLAWIAALAAVAALVGYAGTRELALHAGTALTLAALFVSIRPDPRDQVCGERGVQIGWDVGAFESLLEWRLTGEHLRVRLASEWSAVELAAEHRKRVRARLVELVPERESRFHDRQEPPLFARLPANRPPPVPPAGTSPPGGTGGAVA